MMPDERDRQRFDNSALWPLYPWLPLKSYAGVQPGGLPKFAIMHADLCPTPRNGKYVVFHVDIGDRLSALTDETVKRDEYGSIDELMAAGWMVD